MIRLWRWALRHPILVFAIGAALLLAAVVLYGASGEQSYGVLPDGEPPSSPLGAIAFVTAVVTALSGLQQEH